jgi:hypothetical protein
VCLAATTLLALRHPLPASGAANEAPASQSEPFVPVSLSHDDGPVQLTTRYQVPAERLAEFLDAAADLGRMRRRAGALHWGLYSTQADAAILDRLAALHQGPGKPQLTASLGHDFSRHRRRRRRSHSPLSEV